MAAKLMVTLLGLLIGIMWWVPLWIVSARDPYAMPVVLAVFAFAGSFVGGLVTVVGLIHLVIHASRASKPVS